MIEFLRWTRVAVQHAMSGRASLMEGDGMVVVIMADLCGTV